MSHPSERNWDIEVVRDDDCSQFLSNGEWVASICWCGDTADRENREKDVSFWISAGISFMEKQK